jgi:galactose mutarotase-like enzyme
VTLHAGDYSVSFRPDVAMLCTSLQYQREEYVAWPRTLSEFRAGSATAVPLMHPWGNRLAEWGYTVDGVRVDLHGCSLPVDSGGLPLHGNLLGASFEVVRQERAWLSARLDYGAHPDKLRAFPFPHVVTVEARLDRREGLTITTEVEPTSDRAVPISFCWHPYLRLPDAARSEWMLRWPECEHVDVDERVIPTGERTAQPAECAPVGRRHFDDHYALGADRTFSLAAAGLELTLVFDDAYPFAQLFVPPRKRLVAIEPMTAEINALGSGMAPLCEPGRRFRATFRIAATR